MLAVILGYAIKMIHKLGKEIEKKDRYDKKRQRKN